MNTSGSGGYLLLGANNVTITGLIADDGPDVTGTGTVTLSGTNTISDNSGPGDYTSGFLAGGTIDNLGTLGLDGEVIDTGVFNNQGTVTLISGGIAGNTINNISGATINVTDGSVLDSTTINNAGLLVLNGAQYDIVVGGFLNNTGVIQQSGTVYFEHGMSNSGTI
jgi:hypothetical protein